MASETNVVLSLVYVLFLLVPGYLALRGYLDATIQLDTISRIDKILTTVVAGGATLALVLIFNRFNIFIVVVDFWYAILEWRWINEEIGYSAENSVTLDDLSDITALGFLGVVTFQSLLGYIGGYLYGTFVHVRSFHRSRSHEDLEQPWQTAVRQSATGQELTVITKNGDEIRGKLYRIGSHSEDYDLLLSAAEKVVVGGDPIPLGVTYHHYEDISQVRFPEIIPENPDTEGNRLMKTYSKLRSKLTNIRHSIRKNWGRHYYGFTESRIYDAVEHANRLSTQLNVENDINEHSDSEDQFQ